MCEAQLGRKLSKTRSAEREMVDGCRLRIDTCGRYGTCEREASALSDKSAEERWKEVLASYPADLPEKLLDMAFRHDLPHFYGNTFYVSGTRGDVRIAIATQKPVRYNTTDTTIDKFVAAVTLPIESARELADAIL